MKYITYEGDTTPGSLIEYNTVRYPESDLQHICDEWSRIDGIRYHLEEYEA